MSRKVIEKIVDAFLVVLISVTMGILVLWAVFLSIQRIQSEPIYFILILVAVGIALLLVYLHRIRTR